MRNHRTTTQLASLIDAAVRRHPDRVALVDGERSVTFGEFRRGALAVRSRLADHGLAEGDVIAVRLQNTVRHLVTLVGSIYAGMTIVPISDRLTEPETRHILADSGARALLQDPGTETFMGPTQMGRQIVVVPIDQSLVQAGEVSEGAGVHLDSVQARFLPYTSGTTGKPKGVVMAPGSRALLISSLVEHYGFTAEDTLLAALPIAHSAGLTFTLAHVVAGGKVVLTGTGFSPEALANSVRQHSCTTTLLVPTMLESLARSGVAGQLLSVRRWIVTGSPLSTKAHRRFADKVPNPPIWQYYGATESPHMTLLSPSGAKSRPGSVGRAFAEIQLRICDETGQRAPIGQSGEICVRSPWMLEAYHDNGAATEEALRDGWYRTGDLGRLDQDGFLFLTGRKRDVIISGGLNVYPAEVEAALCEHPHVDEAAVVGLPDDYWGEKVVAAVVRTGLVNAEELTDHCRERLASYKKPSQVIFVPSLPCNHMGKVDKKALRRLAASVPVLDERSAASAP